MHKFVLAAVAASVVLVACGGGGGDSAAPVSGGAVAVTQSVAPAPVIADQVDKYVGTWSVCVNNAISGTNIKEKLVYTKASVSSLDLVFTQTDHTDTACTSVDASPFTSTSLVAFVGTKTIGAVLADKVSIWSVPPSPASPAEKDVAFIDGNLLKVGSSAVGATNDTDGFPTAFDITYIYTKQP